MSALFQVTAINACCAAGLALLVAIAGRYVKRPAVVHALWIVVLLQLFMPPVLPVGLLPAPAPLHRLLYARRVYPVYNGRNPGASFTGRGPVYGVQ